MMNQDDRPQLKDVAAALGLLSRLPVRLDTGRATARGARASWAYPLAGLIIGYIGCVVAQIALWLGVPAPLAAGLMLAALIIVTGAMHEDGLADTVDGFWGGWTKARRLEIMKDSHIGVYGVIAVVLGLGLRWQALTLILGADALWSAVLSAAVLSRAAMVLVMAHLPNARITGLSHAVGRPTSTTSLMALGVAVLTTLVLCQFAGLWILFVALVAALACAAVAKAKIGGQTGDILGATQQISEIATLLTLAAILF